MANPPKADGKSARRAPSGLQAELGWLYVFAKDTTESQLKEERTPERAAKLAAKLERLAEREINSIHQKISSLGEAGAHLMPACQKGCWYCCTHLVTATVPEVMQVANHIRETWTAEQIAALRERIAKHKIAIQPMRDGVEGFIPRHACPLLQEGACSVWSARPLTCRGWNSVSVEDCRVKMENPESGIRERALAHQMAVADFVRQGLEEGLAHSKANGNVCDLAYGLEIALDNPDAMDRYLAGDDLFMPARVGLENLGN
jgi:uncharacterized protein